MVNVTAFRDYAHVADRPMVPNRVVLWIEKELQVKGQLMQTSRWNQVRDFFTDVAEIMAVARALQGGSITASQASAAISGTRGRGNGGSDVRNHVDEHSRGPLDGAVDDRSQLVSQP